LNPQIILRWFEEREAEESKKEWIKKKTSGKRKNINRCSGQNCFCLKTPNFKLKYLPRREIRKETK